MIVISDPKLDQQNYHLKDFVIFETYENIPNRLKHIIDNYDTIFKNLFQDFDLKKIDNSIKNMSLSTINDILN